MWSEHTPQSHTCTTGAGRSYIVRHRYTKERIRTLNISTLTEQFDERITIVRELLTAVEQQRRETNGPASNDAFQTVNAIGLLITELEYDARRQGIFLKVTSTLKSLRRRYDQLTRLPSREAIALLQNLLAFDNLCILGIDVDFRWKQARVEVVRLAAIDRDEQVLFHDALNQERSRMKPIWEELCARLRGRFILAHELAGIQSLLASTAHHYGLGTPALIGASFAELWRAYLAPGCNTSGAMAGGGSVSDSPLFDALHEGRSEQTALGHARTMLSLLKRIAQGA